MTLEFLEFYVLKVIFATGGHHCLLQLEATTFEKSQRDYLWLVELQFIVAIQYKILKLTGSLFITVSHHNSLWSEDTSFGNTESFQMLLLLAITKCGALWTRKFVSLIASGHQTLTSVVQAESLCVCWYRLSVYLPEVNEIHQPPRKRRVTVVISLLCVLNWLMPYKIK